MRQTNISRVLEIINKSPNIRFTVSDLHDIARISSMNMTTLANSLVDLVNYEYINRSSVSGGNAHYEYYAKKEKKELIDGRIPRKAISAKRANSQNI